MSIQSSDLGALTPEVLTRILQTSSENSSFKVTGVTSAPVGTGQMADTLRLSLEFDTGPPEHVPQTLVLKRPSSDSKSRMTGQAMGAYEVEVKFYQDLAPKLGVTTPVIYEAEFDEDSKDFLILMEDLHPRRQGDQLRGCTPDQASAAIHELVGLHAPLWGDESLLDHKWLRQNWVGVDLMIAGVWNIFLEMYADRIDDAVRQAGAMLVDCAALLAKPAPVQVGTVVHTDYRLDNLMFPESLADGHVVVVDWQTVAYGNAMYDVAYFIGASLLEEDRRTCEGDLVRDYYEKILLEGVENYSWDECWTDYRRSAFGGLMMAIGASTMVERTERGDEMFLAMAHRHSHHILDVAAAGALR